MKLPASFNVNDPPVRKEQDVVSALAAVPESDTPQAALTQALGELAVKAAGGTSPA